MRKWGGGGAAGSIPGEKGARCAQGVELKEDAESGILMVAAIRRIQKITPQHCVIFCNRTKGRAGKKKTTKQNKKWGGNRDKRVREAGSLDLPAPPL